MNGSTGAVLDAPAVRAPVAATTAERPGEGATADVADTVDVRCPRCNKLLVRVVRPAECRLDLQCNRCHLNWRSDVEAE